MMDEYFYGDVVYEIEIALDCTTSDAQGFLDAHERYLSEAEDQGMSPADAARYIVEKTENERPE